MLTIAEKSGSDIRNISPEMVKNGIHSRLDILVKGTLDMYLAICPQIEALVKRALTSTPSVFDYSTLDQHMQEIHSLRDSVGIGAEEVKRLFLESGVIGVKDSRHNLPTGNKVLLVGLFEYQVKGTLILTNRSTCVIHPMFYQELLTDIDKDIFVYPMPAEDEEREVLTEAGIVLGRTLS
jgi:hypothetical protein